MAGEIDRDTVIQNIIIKYSVMLKDWLEKPNGFSLDGTNLISSGKKLAELFPDQNVFHKYTEHTANVLAFPKDNQRNPTYGLVYFDEQNTENFFIVRKPGTHPKDWMVLGLVTEELRAILNEQLTGLDFF